LEEAKTNFKVTFNKFATNGKTKSCRAGFFCNFSPNLWRCERYIHALNLSVIPIPIAIIHFFITRFLDHITGFGRDTVINARRA
ncbi:hypothetical protein ACVF7U_003369, partial [Cronobacter sakazakii]